MIDALKRKLGLTTAPNVDAEASQVAVELNDAAVVEASADAAALQTALTNALTELTAANETIAKLTAEVKAAVEFNAAKEQAALEAALAARKEAVVAAVGTEKADALMAATDGMNEAAFTAVLSAVTVAQTTEAKTTMFKEVGVEAEADAVKLAASSNGTMDYLTNKYK